jgi:CheY-like chemotaxis protein
MYYVLLVDAYKSSTVMTSEVLKDNFSGVRLDVVSTGRACIEAVQKEAPQLIVVDFDLPDVDGVTLAKHLRQHYSGPIIMTAFADDVVQQAIEAEQYLYADLCAWLKKPLQAKEFVEVVKRFVVDRTPIYRTFSTSLAIELAKSAVAKKGSEAKKTPPIKGHTVEISGHEAGLAFDKPLAVSNLGDIVWLTLPLGAEATKATKAGLKAASSKKATKGALPTELKLQAEIVWMDKTGQSVKVKFPNLQGDDAERLEQAIRHHRNTNHG